MNDVEGVKISDILDLVKKAEENWEAMKEQRAAHEKELRLKLADAVKEEEALQRQLKRAQTIAGNMAAEYKALEAKAETRARAEVEEREIKEEDVKEGRVSMTEFHRRGKTAKQRAELAIDQMLKEMAEALQALRAKNREILELELAVFKKHRQIYQLSLYPAQVLMKAYNDQHDFVDRASVFLLNDRIQSDASVKLKEHELHLADGKSLGGGHVWRNLTLEKAREIAFSPILSERFIPELRKRLAALEGTGCKVSVTLHMGLGGPQEPYISVDVAQEGKIIKTRGKIFEKRGGKIVERDATEKTTFGKD